MKIRNRVRKIRLENFNYGNVIPKRTMEARDADFFLRLIDREKTCVEYSLQLFLEGKLDKKPNSFILFSSKKLVQVTGMKIK